MDQTALCPLVDTGVVLLYNAFEHPLTFLVVNLCFEK